jgi:hypothetical protein
MSTVEEAESCNTEPELRQPAAIAVELFAVSLNPLSNC